MTPGRLIKRGKRKGQFEPDPNVVALAAAQQEQRQEFLKLLWHAGSVRAACLMVSMSPTTIAAWEKEPEFGKALDLVRKKLAFLDHYRRFGTEFVSARHARIAVLTHKKWLEEDLDYANAFKQAQIDTMDIAESELRQRGIEGVKKPVFYKGMQVATVVEKDTTALIFHLKGRRRNVYGDKTEVSGAGGGPIAMQMVDRLQAGRQRVAQRALPEKASPDAIEGQVIEE